MLEHYRTIFPNELTDNERDHRQSTSYSTEEILAQAVCQASTTGTQLEQVYAVGRNCTASTGNCDHSMFKPTAA